MKTNSTWQPRIYVLVTESKPHFFFGGLRVSGNSSSLVFTEELTQANRLTRDEAYYLVDSFHETTGLPLRVINLHDFLTDEQVLLLRVFHPTCNEWGDANPEAELAENLSNRSVGEA